MTRCTQVRDSIVGLHCYATESECFRSTDISVCIDHEEVCSTAIFDNEEVSRLTRFTLHNKLYLIRCTVDHQLSCHRVPSIIDEVTICICIRKTSTSSTSVVVITPGELSCSVGLQDFARG